MRAGVARLDKRLRMMAHRSTMQEGAAAEVAIRYVGLGFNIGGEERG